MALLLSERGVDVACFGFTTVFVFFFVLKNYWWNFSQLRQLARKRQESQRLRQQYCWYSTGSALPEGQNRWLADTKRQVIVKGPKMNIIIIYNKPICRHLCHLFFKFCFLQEPTPKTPCAESLVLRPTDFVARQLDLKRLSKLEFYKKQTGQYDTYIDII